MNSGTFKSFKAERLIHQGFSIVSGENLSGYLKRERRKCEKFKKEQRPLTSNWTTTDLMTFRPTRQLVTITTMTEIMKMIWKQERINVTEGLEQLLSFLHPSLI
jgi:hypothetical protein